MREEEVSTSYNGWWASENLPTRALVIAGEEFTPGILDDDDVYTVLHYVAQQVHERVEPIVRDDWHQADDWGYNYRNTTGDEARTLSNHSSGTAIDYNATRHPYGVPASQNYRQDQIEEIHKILEEVGVVEWGGDYQNNPQDAMHFDIKGTKAEVAAAARRIRAMQEEDEMAQYEDTLKRIEKKLDSNSKQNKRIIEKLNKSREREIATNKLLRELRDSLESDSPIRSKLTAIIDSLEVVEDAVKE